MDSTIGSPASTKPFDEVSEASPKPSPSDAKPIMMLAPTTKRSPDRERTLIEDAAEPTFDNSDNGKGDIEGGSISEASKKDGVGGLSMQRKKLIFIVLGVVLLICIIGGSLGANALRNQQNNANSALLAGRRFPVPLPDQEMDPKPPVDQNRITNSPTLKPTISNAIAPTSRPMVPPAPTNNPTASPTVKPTASPTVKPTSSPTIENQPTATPTVSPAPTKSPTSSPSSNPTMGPTISPEPTGIPSASPTTDYVALIQNFLYGTYGVDVFSWSKPSQKNMLAIEWLASEAKESNTVELNGKFLQRFVLLTQDLSVQGAKDAGDLPRNAQKGVDECDWHGIVCDSDNWVTEILWSYQEAKKGSISPELRHLVGSLKVLDLSNNEMKEEIPEELYQLTNLEKLILFNNELKGTISPKIGDLDSITHFHLSHNKLKGPFPVEIKSDNGIRPLVYFNVYSNKLTGTLPEDMRLRQVTYFDVGRNELSGTLPVTLGEKFVSLRHLHLDHNYFTGTLPLSYNTVGNGRLESFSIDHNYLTGRVPGTRDLYNKLVQYTLHSNQFDRMSSNVCRMEVPRGEMVELRTDCAICICEGFFDLCDVQCLEEPSESPTESPTKAPVDDNN